MSTNANTTADAPGVIVPAVVESNPLDHVVVPTNERPEMAESGRDSGKRRCRSRRDKAILALMTAKSVTEAARTAGVGERTLRRWLREDAAFKAEYDAARLAAFTTVRQRIQQLAGRAVDALDELLDAKKHPSVRLGAARTIMEIALYQHDVDSLMGKLNELEQLQRLRKS